MSFAFGLFAVGVSCIVVILLLSGWYKHHHATTIAYAGGIWALLPVSRHVVPHDKTVEILNAIQGHPVSDVFFFHYTITTRLGYTHMNFDHYISAVFLTIMGCILCLYGYLRHRANYTKAEI